MATTPLLLIIGRIIPQLKEYEGHGITRQVVPFIASIVSLCIMLLPIVDLPIPIALTVNGLMVTKGEYARAIHRYKTNH